MNSLVDVIVLCGTFAVLIIGTSSSGCNPSSMVSYNLTFYGDWTRKAFPKMYPKYRPPAQWSELVGRSHNDDYNLFTMGERATPKIQAFAENRDTSRLDGEAQGADGILDVFTAPPLSHGTGHSSVTLFVDGAHSKLSFVVKIVPSPDWFVGIDSEDLCRNGKWKRKIRLNLPPLDAGTDQGLTFTSPNWPSYPPENIYQITSTFPNHRAGAFSYPKLKKLPRIAHVILYKNGDFRNLDNNDVAFDISSSRSTSSETSYENVSDEIVTTLNDEANRSNQDDDSTQIILGDDESVDQFEKEYENEEVEATAMDCVVGEWGGWGPCSKTCGFGRKERHRVIFQKHFNGGRPCPLLRESTICGSMRGCGWKHFSRGFSLFNRKPKSG